MDKSDEFPLGKENYCPQCYFEDNKAVLKTECKHAPKPEEPVKKLTGKDILAEKRELFMNSPIGYPYAERIEKSEVGRLKSFLINLFASDEKYGDAIREATHEEVIDTFLNNGFTFDPEWYGVRELPKGVDGRPISRLDDPEYQRKMGFRPTGLGQ